MLNASSTIPERFTRSAETGLRHKAEEPARSAGSRFDYRGAAENNIETWRRDFGLRATQTYRSGAELFSAGSPGHDVFVIVRGVVGLYYHADEDRMPVFCLLGLPGDLLNVCTPESRMLTPVSGVALTVCEAYRVTIDELEHGQRHDARLTTLFQRYLQRELLRRTDVLARTLTQSPAERLKDCLRRLGATIGRRESGHSVRFVLPLTDDQLASLLGVSVRQLQRLKKELDRSGFARFDSRRWVALPQSN